MSATTAAARPVVSILSAETAQPSSSTPMPAVFSAPIRNDIVQFVHTNMRKNSRQPYAVSKMAGTQTSAASWGTGRAVSRIPRVPGGGTHRSGQGAYGNMCRGGRMFAPTKIWRKWHRKVPVNQKRYATVSALAASALPALVMARGHEIDDVPEVPLVIDNSVEAFKKTAKAVTLLKSLGAYDDVERVMETKKQRAGKGKMRNRRYKQRRGPLVVYDKDDGIVKAFRNLPGLDLCSVHRLNLLQLAPGGHVGRFIIWTEAAVNKLDTIYGTGETGTSMKSNYMLPKCIISNSDVARIINSDEIQSVVRPIAERKMHIQRKKNPLRNKHMMYKLNPHARVRKPETKLEKTPYDKAIGQAFYEKMMAD
ncbi:60S ribosomal protein L4-A [Gracilariopsis chorda]|uniref:60S ribosomal protein L4-A n=1 Tax=Gracilariopsis chorda TaxID=448386 RepID=A0A2V3J0S5_9FLOR|nr:60S ribosomal protein L4-A [Gracilariopsis chorda]|eukprot:PXF47935.1 60S ribosomal protein L4-A [Gracilariopsis chorda]